jgi:hypothetical protein
MKFDNNKKIILVIFVFIIILFYFSYAVYALNQSSIYLENGLLENIQVITLFLACVSFIFPVFSQSRSDKLMLIFFSFLCFSFILREVGVEELDIAYFLIFIGHDIGRNIMLIIGFSSMTLYAIFHFEYYRKLVKVFFSSRGSKIIIPATILLYVGDFFEHSHSILHYVFLEEMFELSGYVLILITALFFWDNKLSPVNNINKVP